MAQLVRIILKSPLKNIFEEEVGKKFIEFNQHYFISQKDIKESTIIKGQLGLSFFYGIYKSCDLLINGHRVKKIGLASIIPNPLMFFVLKKIIIPKNSPHFIIEFDQKNIAPEKRPLSITDHHLYASRPSIEYDRIQNLIGKMTLIEKKETGIGLCFFYKSNDERTWQLWNDHKGFSHLECITQQQWTYDYIAARENKKNLCSNDLTTINSSDLEYLECLEKGPSNILCEEQDCHQVAAKGSSLCANHHFELITGKKIKL